jgi:hypothetical protein
MNEESERKRETERKQNHKDCVDGLVCHCFFFLYTPKYIDIVDSLEYVSC